MKLKTYHKEREYVAPRIYGGWTPGTLFRALQNVSIPGGNFARPYPYFALLNRIKAAWDVFTYRADALYWKEPRTTSLE